MRSELYGCGPAMIAMHDGGTIAIVFGPSAASTCRTDNASTQPGHAACPEHRMGSSCSSSFCICSPDPDGVALRFARARPPDELGDPFRGHIDSAHTCEITVNARRA